MRRKKLSQMLYDPGDVGPGGSAYARRSPAPEAPEDPSLDVRREGLFLRQLLKAKRGEQLSAAGRRRLASGGGILSVPENVNPEHVVQKQFSDATVSTLLEGYRKRRGKIPINTGAGSLYDL